MPAGRDQVIFGGTFDPPHLGHMAVIRGLRRELRLPLLVIPNGSPPHRSQPTAPARERLHLLRLSVEELRDPLVTVSDLEVNRPGPSYTADTLAALVAGEPGRRLLLALGADAASQLAGWERSELVLSLARLVIFDRLGSSAGGEQVLEGLRRRGLPVGGARLLQLSAPEVEASEVRRRLGQGDPCPRWLSPAVAAQIAALGLYGWGKSVMG